MKKSIVLLCIIIAISLLIPVYALPKLPNPDSLPILEDPRLELLTFTPPENLRLVEVGKNKVSIKWDDTSIVETGFEVERRKESGKYAVLVTLGRDSTTYTDVTAESDTVYYYRVRAAKDSEGIKTGTKYTEYSNELKVDTSATQISKKDKDLIPTGGAATPPAGQIPGGATIPGTTPGITPETIAGSDTIVTPLPPVSLTAEILDENSVELSWVDKSDNETGFQLFRDHTGVWEEVAVIGADVTEYIDETLMPSTTYYYTIRSYKDSAASQGSNVIEITTPEPAPLKASSQAPAGPEGLTAQATSPASVALTWQDKSDNEDGFILFRASTGDWEQIGTLAANTVTYEDKAVQPNTLYYYIIYAYKGEDFSKESNMAEITTPNQGSVAVDFTGASSWALEELAKAVEYGLYTDRVMNNYTQNITREEFCELVVKLYEKLTGAVGAAAPYNTFVDTTNEGVLKAYKAGIVNGTGKDTFSPSNFITRQDICVMLYRAITVSVVNVNTSIDGASVFEDDNLVGSWAVKEIKFASKNGIMKGSGAKIMPLDNTSREQALLLIKRTYEMYGR